MGLMLLILRCWMAWMIVPVGVVWGGGFTVAFYYGDHVPVDELKAFDVVVVDSKSGVNPKTYRTAHSELFAYAGIGEVDSSRTYAHDIPSAWIIGKNTVWNSQVIDQSQTEWPNFVVQKIITPLWNQGYRGFFLDTLDSYHLAAATKEEKAQQEQGLINVIRAIKKAYPPSKLIFNRGFEIIPDVANLVYAVAAESLFYGWDQAHHQFVEVSKDDREWLLTRLRTIRQSYHVPIIILDYVPADNREKARMAAKKIQSLGMIPWISTPALDLLGIGALEVLPRKILAIYDGGMYAEAGESALHRFVDMPLNYLGYVVEHWDVRSALPQYPLVGRYAGIVSWINGNEHRSSQRYHEWLVSQIHQGLRVVFFDSFGFPIRNDLLKPFQLQTDLRQESITHVEFSLKDQQIGYEIDPIATRRDFVPLRLTHGRTLLRVQTATGEQEDAVAYTAWGGYALNPYAILQLPGQERYRWIIDPIRFLQAALNLSPMPVPDTTTENGRRLLLVHIDGDGFPSKAEMPGTPYAGEVLYRDILQKYRLPTTVSIIEGEIGPTGLHPRLAHWLERTARAMFALPQVEIASHSYSHPFEWRVFSSLGPQQPGKYNLNVPGYQFGPGSIHREIEGSIHYINQRLAPKGKQVKVFLWSGDTDPSPEAVGETYTTHVQNMNGGDTLITKENHTLTAVAPLGIQKGRYFQTYAPNQNENLYTNNWRGPFYGFQTVIETFQLTDQPRRLKPIDVYYHIYSASKKASLAALHKVYRWVLAQPVNPVFASDYIQKVHGFNRTVVARDHEGWLVRGNGRLREFRIPQSFGYPDLVKSRGVMGFFDYRSMRYLHLTGESEVRIALGKQPSRQPSLVETNGQVLQWLPSPRGVEIKVLSYQPLTVVMANVTHCRLKSSSGTMTAGRKGSVVTVHAQNQWAKPIRFTCV